jgi:hypothetical protein
MIKFKNETVNNLSVTFGNLPNIFLFPIIIQMSLKVWGPKVWGPKFWYVFHSVSLSYSKHNPTKAERKQYKYFYEDFQYILPCPTCRRNYYKHLKELPLTDRVLRSSKSLFTWTVMMHNKVNKELNKREIEPKTALKLYI